MTAGTTTDSIDAALATPGHISGTVTAETGGAPVADAWVEAYQWYSEGSDGWWEPLSSGRTASDGTYDVGGLPTGTYRVSFYDESGTYLGECYDDATSVDFATDIPVTAGATTGSIDAALASAGHITGTVTAEVGGVPIADVAVSVYKQYQDGIDSWWEEIRGTYTASDGTYDLGGLPTGTYRVGFRDSSGAMAFEYYDNATAVDAATDVPVTAGSTTPDIDAALVNAGHIAGTVTAEAGGAQLAGVWVSVYAPSGAGWAEIGGTETGADGTYDVSGLASGSYRIGFSDYSDTYVSEYYEDAASVGTATDVPVIAGSTTPDIDAALSTPGHIAGTVTAEVGGAPLGDVFVSIYRLYVEGATSSGRRSPEPPRLQMAHMTSVA